MSRPVDSVYSSQPSPGFKLAVLNEEDTLSYLRRLKLDAAVLAEPPSLDLLSKLLLAHLLNVPFDTSALHVVIPYGQDSDWHAPSEKIKLGAGKGMNLGRRNFERVILEKQGGYCYSLNILAAALLRGFGFRVSEVGARVYMNRGKDPKVAGYDCWTGITHELLIVDWPEAQDRFIFDVGFGGNGCGYPILLRDGVTSASLCKFESFLLREENLPIGELTEIADPAPGFTLYRRVLPKDVQVKNVEDLDPSPGYWSPCYHFTVQSLLPLDIVIADLYNSTSPDAVWMNCFVTTLLLPDGARKTLMYVGPKPSDSNEENDGAPKAQAKLYIKDGIMNQERDVRMIDFETGPMRKVLREEFGFAL